MRWNEMLMSIGAYFYYGKYSVRLGKVVLMRHKYLELYVK